MIIIKAGEWLTHEDGTKYAKALRDITAMSDVRGEDFELADGSTPQKHSIIPDDVVKSKNGWIEHANINGRWYWLRQSREAQDEAYGLSNAGESVT